MRCRNVDTDDAVFWFRSVATAAAAVACNTFVQTIDGDGAAAPTSIGRAF